jgi:SAM-dependent methyltransferase
MSKSLVQKQFGANAARYATSGHHARGASLPRLVELIDPQPNWHMLDIATGAGHTALAFAPRVAHVIASDITQEMLDTAAGLAAKNNLSNLSFEYADAEELPYPDASFDLVTCRIAPHHFQNVQKFVNEAARVLRPGALFALVDNVVPDPPTGDEPDAGAYINAFEKLRDPSHNRALSMQEWHDTFVRAGLTVEHSEITAKETELQDWAERMAATPGTIAELRLRLLDAPPSVTEYLNTQERDGKLYFYLAEALILGRKG